MTRPRGRVDAARSIHRELTEPDAEAPHERRGTRWGGIGDAETVEVLDGTGNAGTVVDVPRGRIRHDRERDKTSPRALVRRPVSSRATSGR